jgi:DNA repair photolyase
MTSNDYRPEFVPEIRSAIVESRPKLRITEIICKSALTPSKIQGIDYALNPYLGCSHRCIYCYATYLGRWHHPGEPWGSFVDARLNVADRLAAQLRRTDSGSIHLGTATDPYQPLERRYGLTRACLERLVFFGGEVSILTKSDLVLRDRALLSGLENCHVGLTVTSTDAAVTRTFEPGAPVPERRLKALRELKAAGVHTHAFAGPLLPGVGDGEAEIKRLFESLVEAGVEYAYVDATNLSYSLWEQVRGFVTRHSPELLPVFHHAKHERPAYLDELRERVKHLMACTGLNARVLF